MKQTALFPPSQSILFSLEKEMLKNGMAAPLIEAFQAFENLPQPRASLTQLGAFTRAMTEHPGFGSKFGKQEVEALDAYFKKKMADPVQRAYESYAGLTKKPSLKNMEPFVEVMMKQKDYGFLFGESEVRALCWYLRANELSQKPNAKHSFVDATRTRHGKPRSEKAAPRTVAR